MLAVLAGLFLVTSMPIARPGLMLTQPVSRLPEPLQIARIWPTVGHQI